jgi:GntR family transcriptional regulator, transcriptional repressor for pyruvate dehydrogenase complex
MGGAETLRLADSASVLRPMRLRNAGEQIAERLITAIALGEFVPGQRLPTERDLAIQLGVSRTSVREAIHRLAAGGYVTVLRGRNGGAVVQTAWGAGATEMIRALLPDWEHFEWLVDFRGLIEPLIARTAAERRGERDRHAIQTALDDYRRAAGPEASRAADLALHDAIARATHNPYLVGVSRQIRAQLSVGFGSQRYSQAIRARAVAQHADLAAAIAKGHADEAAEAAARHLTLVDESLLRRSHR